MGRLNQKVAVVTGAAQGIGAVLAMGLAAEGARVVVADLLDTSASVAAIKKAGAAAIGVKVDVTSGADLARMVEETERAFGPIEILINNAGIFASLSLKPFWMIDEAEWDKVMTVNARGVMQAAKACLPSMKKNGRGKIVNVSSGTFFYGPPGMMHYVASKGAVFALTRSMARELGPMKITVNSITPGFTESEGVKANPEFEKPRAATKGTRAIDRDMLPTDLVGAVLFLASPDSDFITGQALNIDGGKITW